MREQSQHPHGSEWKMNQKYRKQPAMLNVVETNVSKDTGGENQVQGRRKMRFFCLILFFVSVSTFSAICTDFQITNIKAEDGRILFHMTNGSEAAWHKLGSYSDLNLNSKLSIALTALTTGSKINVEFPNVACGTDSWGESTNYIQIKK